MEKLRNVFAQPLHEPHERRVAHRPPASPHLVRGGAYKSWAGNALAHGAFHHQVQALAGSLNQPASVQRLGQAAVARYCWSMMFSGVMPGGGAARPPPQPLGKLPHNKDGATQPVVPMGHRVQRWPRANLPSSRWADYAEEILLAAVVAQVDLFSTKRVRTGKKPAVFLTRSAAGPAGFGRAVLPTHQLGLRQPPRPGLPVPTRRAPLARLVALHRQFGIAPGLRSLNPLASLPLRAQRSRKRGDGLGPCGRPAAPGQGWA